GHTVLVQVGIDVD
ncbi:hypothetical protein A2U01_0076821, partial [Trifolium medium]|nr:hypothetical protein [Trifolium medium]